jgi:hypothetical protein
MTNTDLHVRHRTRTRTRTRTRDIAVPPELLAQWDVQLSQGEGRA